MTKLRAKWTRVRLFRLQFGDTFVLPATFAVLWKHERYFSVSKSQRQFSGLDRSRWLAELAEALKGTRDVLGELDASASTIPANAELASHVANAIAEVDSLRRGGNSPFREGFDPKPMKFSPNRPDRRRN